MSSKKVAVLGKSSSGRDAESAHGAIRVLVCSVSTKHQVIGIDVLLFAWCVARQDPLRKEMHYSRRTLGTKKASACTV